MFLCLAGIYGVPYAGWYRCKTCRNPAKRNGIPFSFQHFGSYQNSYNNYTLFTPQIKVKRANYCHCSTLFPAPGTDCGAKIGDFKQFPVPWKLLETFSLPKASNCATLADGKQSIWFSILVRIPLYTWRFIGSCLVRRRKHGGRAA